MSDVELTAEDREVIEEVGNPVESWEGDAPVDEKEPIQPSEDKEEKPVGSEEPTEESQDEITEDIKAQAQQYGLDPSLFSSADQLQKQMRAMDAYWMEQTRRQRAVAQQQQQAATQWAAPPQPTQAKQELQPPELPFKLELPPEEYPPELTEKFNAALAQVHEYYRPMQEQLGQVQQMLQQQQVQQEVQQFESAVATLGHKQLFGDPSTRTQAQMANAQRLYQEAETLAEVYRMQGRPLPDVPTLVKRAEEIAFADQLKQYQQQTRNARLQKQAQQKLGTGKRQSKAFTPEGTWDGEPEDNPVLIKAWNELQEERGER